MRFNLKRWSMVVPVVIALIFSVNSAVAATSTNSILNHSFEIYAPYFWSAGSAGGTLYWGPGESHSGARSLKITKTTTGTAASWKSENHAQLYWNNMGGEAGDVLLYNVGAWVKLADVNTDPVDDADKIGLRWLFYDDQNALIQSNYVYVDQSAATAGWVEFSESILLSEAPAHAYCEALMGSDATGTVWFDDFILGSDPWTAGFFGGNCETPTGWMEWHATDAGAPLSTSVLQAGDAHSGVWSVKLGDTDGDDEAVYYSIPVEATPDTDYLVGVWAKMTANESDSSAYHPSGPMQTRLGDRVNLCFFFHAGSVTESWTLTGGGDQFINFDQTKATADLGEGEWKFYWAIVTSPSDASGFSMRARINPDFVGTCYFDDFVFEEVTVGANSLVNGDLETATPFFHNAGSAGGTLTWATDEFRSGSHSLKIAKIATGTEASWVSDDQAHTYWNNMGGDDGTVLLYNVGAWVKLAGVNSAPSTDAERIGVRWTFTDASYVEIQTNDIYVVQSAATADWAEFTGSILLSAVPAHAYCEALMGSDATGTVWFDDFILGSDPWTAGYFGGNCETPAGWMEWHATDGLTPLATSEVAVVAAADAHSGTHVAKLADVDGDDEIVVYSIPVAVTADTWYEFSVFVKAISVDTVSTNAAWYKSPVVTVHQPERVGLCFFFHAGSLEESWGLTGGDQFAYFDQYATIETPEWVEYRVISKAPSDAVGASLRARFNNNVVAEVWFDDFAISSVTVEELGVLDDIFARRAIPTTITLRQNYPNPFNSTTLITYSLPEAGQVQLQVFDLLGRRIATLFSGMQTSGGHSVTFNGISENGLQLGSGVYFYRLSTPTQSVVRKMLYIK